MKALQDEFIDAYEIVPTTPLSTLTKWAREGKLTGAFKIGKKWVIQEVDWVSFFRKRKRGLQYPSFSKTTKTL